MQALSRMSQQVEWFQGDETASQGSSSQSNPLDSSRNLSQMLRLGDVSEAQAVEPRIIGCVACDQMSQLRDNLVDLSRIQTAPTSAADTQHNMATKPLKEQYIVSLPLNLNNECPSPRLFSTEAQADMRCESVQRCGLLTDNFSGSAQSAVETSYQAQTTGIIPGSDEQVSLANGDYFKQWTRAAETIELDQNIDICFMPNRVGTRSTQATQSCFLCAPETDRIYVFNTQKPIGYTVNSKPYTDQTHMLFFPTDHQPSVYQHNVFLDCVAKIGDHARQQMTNNQRPTWTGLFAGPVGGSQPHQHWHVLSKNTRVEDCVNNPNNLRQIAFDKNSGNGIFHVTSESLKDLDGQQHEDPKRGELHYFDCLLVRGSESYLADQAQKIVDHLSELTTPYDNKKTGEAEMLPRAFYNMAILPPDESNHNRLIIFPRSSKPEDSKVERSILWGENKSFNPSAHEMAGHWFMTQKPEDTQGNSPEVFDHLVKTAIYKTAHDIRVPVAELAIDNMLVDEITFNHTPHLTRYPAQSTPEHEAVAWMGWPSSRSASGSEAESQPPLLKSIEPPLNTQGADIQHIVPVLSQTQVNDLYEVIGGAHEVLTDLGIAYFAGAGSLMGAIRHGGQMWNDDDGDFFLKDSDQSHFEQHAQELLADKGLRMQPGWPGYQISKIHGPTREDGTGVPFVDISFMHKVEDQGQDVWRHVDSPAERGEASGPTFIHQVPAQTLDQNETQEFSFGESDAYKGVAIKVPNETVSIDYLNKAYGANWFEVLKTRVHNHIEGTQAKSVTLSIGNHGHVAPKDPIA